MDVIVRAGNGTIKVQTVETGVRMYVLNYNGVVLSNTLFTHDEWDLFTISVAEEVSDF